MAPDYTSAHVHDPTPRRARVIWLLACADSVGPDVSASDDSAPVSDEVLVEGDLLEGERITCSNPELRDSDGPMYVADLGTTWNEQPPTTTGRRDSPGLVVGDITGDGRYEIFLPNKSASWVFRLEADGTMSDLSDALLPDRADHNLWGATGVDYDGDGDLDLFVQSVGDKNRLYRKGVTLTLSVTRPSGRAARQRAA